jgi:alpha-L-fucosidase 2
MLLQSRIGNPTAPFATAFEPEIELLPELPAAWPEGSIRGLRARGGFEVDIAWANGALTAASVRSLIGGIAILRYGETTREIALAAGETFSWDGE